MGHLEQAMDVVTYPISKILVEMAELGHLLTASCFGLGARVCYGQLLSSNHWGVGLQTDSVHFFSYWWPTTGHPTMQNCYYSNV